MNRDKLEEITRIINRDAQPTATEDEVMAFLFGILDARDNDWLEMADAEEIAEWIIEQVWGEE